MNKQSGQTLVEYLMLTLLVVSVIFGIARSDVFKNIIDFDGDLMTSFYRRMRYSYRHALPGNKETPRNPTYTQPNHDSYTSGSSSRFFAPNQGYPRQ